jgi:hypothetical protein
MDALKEVKHDPRISNQRLNDLNSQEGKGKL